MVDREARSLLSWREILKRRKELPDDRLRRQEQGLGVVPQEYAQDGFGNIFYVTPMSPTALDTALMLDIVAGSDTETL